MTVSLEGLVRDELHAPLPVAVREFADRIAILSKRPPAAILFYGSSVRTGDLSGVLDFYVVVDDLADWHRGRFARVANRLLPPNVEYHEATVGDGRLRAKVAILSLAQLRRLAYRRSLDISVWARFCQPVAAPYIRDSQAENDVAAAIAGAVSTAARWAALLGPPEADALSFWRDVFRRTYASELRVETTGRADTIVDFAPARYRDAFAPALAAARVDVENLPDGTLRPALSPAARRSARRAWAGRRLLAKPLNLARLAKAAFTFEGGADYIAWKIERHSGVDIGLTPWQRRHLLLSAAPILWRLWRLGVLR